MINAFKVFKLIFTTVLNAIAQKLVLLKLHSVGTPQNINIKE